MKKLSFRHFYSNEFPETMVNISGKNIHGRITELNSSRAGVIVDESDSADLAIGDEADLTIDPSSKNNQAAGTKIVDLSQVEYNGKQYGKIILSFKDVSMGESPFIDSSGKGMFGMPARYQPFCYADLTSFFKKSILLKLEAVGVFSMIMSTSLGNKEMIPGLFLSTVVHLGHLGRYKIKGHIDKIEIDLAQSILRVRFSYTKPSYKFLRSASEYILCFSDQADPKTMRKQKIPVNGIETAIHVSYANDQKEMLEVLKLRRRVAIDEGRIPESVPPEEMRDRYDNISRQVVFKVAGKVVACVRLIFVRKDNRNSEISNFASIPDKYFKKDFLEISRLVIDPPFRGGDVYIQIIRYCIKIGAETGMHYGFLDCRSFLVKVYKRIGAVDTGMTIDHPFYPNEKMHVMYFDEKYILKRAKGNFIYWSKVMMPILDFCKSRKLFRPGIVIRTQISIGKLVNTLIRNYQAFSWERSITKH